jgi:hypothetical protein
MRRGMPRQPGDMHRQEGRVEADEHQPEHPLAQPVGHHPPRRMRNPVIGPAEQREHHPADQYVMQMRHDEIAVMRLQVERHRRQHHAGQPAQHEDEQKAQHERHRHRQPRAAIG